LARNCERVLARRAEGAVLFLPTAPSSGSLGRVLRELPPRETLAVHLLGRDNADPTELCAWALADYQKDEPFRSYTSRHDWFGVAIRRADFDSWRAKYLPAPQAESAALHLGRSLSPTPPPNMRRRGPEPTKLEQVKESMRRDLREGREIIAVLEAMHEKELLSRYSFVKSRTTVRVARREILAEFGKNLILPNDK
jgi:hypothetical protein